MRLVDSSHTLCLRIFLIWRWFWDSVFWRIVSVLTRRFSDSMTATVSRKSTCGTSTKGLPAGGLSRSTRFLQLSKSAFNRERGGYAVVLVDSERHACRVSQVELALGIVVVS